MTNQLNLLENGLQKCNELLAQYPGNQALQSIAKQIEYLIELVQQNHADKSRLKDITIGVLTAREIEPLDDDAAETFYQIAAIAKTL